MRVRLIVILTALTLAGGAIDSTPSPDGPRGHRAGWRSNSITPIVSSAVA